MTALHPSTAKLPGIALGHDQPPSPSKISASGIGIASLILSPERSTGQSTAYRSNDAPPFNGIGSRECYRGRAGSGPHRVDVGFGWPKITLADICLSPQQQQLFIANDGQRIRRSCGDGDAQDALKVVECRRRVAYNHLIREALIAGFGFGLKRRMSHQLHELSLVILKNFIELLVESRAVNVIHAEIKASGGAEKRLG